MRSIHAATFTSSGFIMEVCCSCGGNFACHTVTDAEKRCCPKMQSHSVTVLWCAVSRCTHIKSVDAEKTTLPSFYRG
ncbi:MAG: hypothetical protein M1540_01740 [Candidatus Bathyarchaeota archaeon]|nr:hypothetical protein [Candidatus Bathyarchaeota archaeon]